MIATLITHRNTAIGRTLLVLAMILALGTMSMAAQQPDKRHVTPVKPETNRVQPPPKGTAEKVIQQYISGDTTAAMQEQRRDSLRRAYHHYPLLTDLSIGINVAEPLFMALGQSYASVDVNATLNMWNRLQPTLELGLGWASNTPDGMNFTYRGKPSPYVKVGANYNFMFKNSPDYQIFLGIRLGYSTFGYDVKDVRYVNTYWQEDIKYSITGEHSHAWWGEAGLGLKVRLVDRLSMGWMVRFHNMFSYGKSDRSRPWFIPGYGPREGSLAVSINLAYTLPLTRKSSQAATTSTAP